MEAPCRQKPHLQHQVVAGDSSAKNKRLQTDRAVVEHQRKKPADIFSVKHDLILLKLLFYATYECASFFKAAGLGQGYIALL